MDAAKLYYNSFKVLQKDSDKPLKVATIFSFAANGAQDAIGDIADESFDVTAMNSSAKEFLSAAIADYNALFKTSFSVESSIPKLLPRPCLAGEESGSRFADCCGHVSDRL